MALVTCKECGTKVSTEAKACPQCGAKPPKKGIGLIGSLFILVVVVAVYNSVTRHNTAPSSAPAIKPIPAVEPVNAEKTRQQQVQESCTTGLAAIVSDAKSFMTAGDPAMAAARLNPCQGISNDKEYLALFQAAERQRIEKAARFEKEEKARKRREGVSVGMSKEDVLASSWGKPQKVNTTTTANATREQWVYGGSNYLYFTNGVLTAIQN